MEVTLFEKTLYLTSRHGRIHNPLHEHQYAQIPEKEQQEEYLWYILQIYHVTPFEEAEKLNGIL